MESNTTNQETIQRGKIERNTMKELAKHIVLQALVINRFYKNRALLSALYKETTQTSDPRAERLEKAYSEYIQLLATLALTITFQAGFHPPGGLWQDNSDGHKAGDPILQLMNARRYTAFFYCNSIAFAASLAIMMLVQIRPLLKHRLLEQAMVLDLLALVGAYAIGSCRQETATVYAMGIGGAALVYVVLHVVMLDPKENHGRLTTQVDDRYDHYLSLDVMGYGLFLFAILVATTTYQAGLTPPGGFVVSNDGSGHHAGDPVLLHNYPGRYRVFFYCNSTSFMVSIAIIILLVNPNIYRPAIRTHALSVCTFVSFVCLLAAFACGTTQHVKTSIHTLVLLAVVFCLAALLFLVFFLRSLLFPVSSSSAAPMTVACADAHAPQEPTDDEGRTRPASRKAKQSWKYQMTVGILVASVTYQGGLDPPGGSWPRSSDGHHAGHPVMRDNMRRRYLIFSYSNSTSFLATIFLMLLSLLMPSPESWMSRTTSPIVMLGCFGLLGAYAAGSNSEWKTSMHVVAIVFSVLAYFGIHVVLLLLRQKGGGQAQAPENIGSGPDEIAPAPRNDDM